jgi:hypothetical protein
MSATRMCRAHGGTPSTQIKFRHHLNVQRLISLPTAVCTVRLSRSCCVKRWHTVRGQCDYLCDSPVLARLVKRSPNQLLCGTSII